MKIEKENAIQAFKAFESDWKCKGFQYEVGKEYFHDGEVVICNSGFHCCKTLADCFNYYPFDNSTKIARVNVWGTVLEHSEDSKICCSNIEILEEISWDEVLKICNTGDCNTGNRNTGDFNTGNRNTGDCNTGNWNTGDWNTGYFNTKEQDQFFCFNKLTKKQDIDFPTFLFFDLIEWIPVACMTDAEKNEHPECDTIGGYLKEKNYKEAFRESFEKAKKKDVWQDQLKKLKAIPNFDEKIFEEISGIHPEELV